MSPVLPSTVLHRPSLVAMLNEAIVGTSAVATGRTGLYKLVLLCAPAGYGKTTLLADFAEHTDIPCCWYFLDHVDTDEIAFLELLLASIRQRFPQFSATIDSRLASAISAGTDGSVIPYRLEAVIDTLVAAIAAEIPERFALVLCNYHEINQSQVINHLVNRLIWHLPSQCILILESRAIPALEFAPLLARREIIGFGSNELRFTVQEICDLAKLQEVEPLSEAEAAHMAQSFDGWITGILLSTRLGDLQPPHLRAPFSSSWGSPAMRMDRQHLFAYLVNEVFTCEPDAYTFLKEAVVLQQMTPSLCAALLDIPDAAVLLNYLEQQGLFVTRCGDGPGKYYICQPMLRELLYDELRTHSPLRFATLHRRAADLFHATQDDNQAIYHSLAAAAYDAAADLIVGTCKQMLARGHSVTLAHWIDALPSEITMHHPQLLLARANIFLSAGEYTQALPLLDAVSAAIKQDSDEDPVLLAEILIARGTVQFQRGDYSGAQELCRQALAMLPVDEGALRVEAYLRLGVCVCLLGNFTDGIVQLRQALQLCGCDMETRQIARLHSALANAYGMLGHHALSEHHRTRAIRCWEHLNDEWGKIDNLVGLGVTKQRQGAFAEAERLLTEALTAACGATHYQRGEAYARVSLGDLYQDQNCYQQALSTFEDGFTLAHQLEDTYLTNYTVRALATTYLLMGDPQTALALISQTDQETACCETVPYYECALRKLILGAILLQQQRYSEAYAHLTTAEVTLHTARLKREQLQAMIRIAACLLGQGDTPASLGRMKEAVALARQSGYELLMLIELRRAPDLLHAMQSMSETTHLCTLLCEEADVQGLPGLPLPSPVLTVSTQDRSTIRVLALGEPIVFLNDVPVTRWRMARAMELCFFLLNAARPLHKEQIIAALWSDVDDQIDQTLRSTFYYLRKVLGKSCIISRCSSFMLDLAAVYGDNVWYDVIAFQEHYVSAQAALTMKDDTVADTAFQEMTRLYRGDYAQSFYSDWCTSRRDELKQAYIDAHHQLALIAWRQHRLDETILHWQHLLTMDSCLEEAHYGLMRCYLRQGRRGLALRQYQRCVESLRDELGTTPGHTIQHLIGI
jgi:LuxR family maltose regulon positive regulatory protein